LTNAPTLLESAIAFATRHELRGSTRLSRITRGAYPITLTRVRTTDGLTFAVDPDSFLDRFILKEGYYEREVLDAILAHLPAGGVFWDVGANAGLHAVTVKTLHPKATVVAFEPAPLTAARLCFNAEMNGAELRLMTVGLGAAPAYLDFSIIQHGNSGLSSFRPWDDSTYETTMRCRVESGDALIAAGVQPAPDVIKIDVEDYELEVLRGLSAWLAAPGTKAIIFESMPAKYSALTALCLERGFTINALAPANPAEHDMPMNFIAQRGT
jgi:FkbM family methyltransferase